MRAEHWLVAVSTTLVSSGTARLQFHLAMVLSNDYECIPSLNQYPTSLVPCGSRVVDQGTAGVLPPTRLQFRLIVVVSNGHKCILSQKSILCSSPLFFIVPSCLQLFLTVRNCSHLVHTGSC
jgi:hypothetical protein